MRSLTVHLAGPTALALLCVFAFSGTDAGSSSPRPEQVVVTGLIPAHVADALATAARAPVRSESYQGSLDIIERLRGGSVDFGAVTSDAAYLAFTGRLDTGSAFTQLRGITALDLKTIHLMAARHTTARTAAELRGANVSLGPPGTGTSLVAELLLNAHGLTIGDLREEYLPIADAAKRLADGELDAAFMPLVVPAADAVLAARAGARLLDIAGPKVEELRLQHPFLLRTLLPHDTYPGQEAPVQTLAVDLLLACRADMNESVVYTFLQEFFGRLSQSTVVTDLNRSSAMPIPLHAGAARYYRERELSR